MKRESENCRILVVEDDAALASMVADFLSPHGFEVAIEGRGDTAVDRIIDENPDAVVLDVNLPGRNGLDVLVLDSLDALELVVAIEKNFGVIIENEDQGKEAFISLAVLARYIQREVNSTG